MQTRLASRWWGLVLALGAAGCHSGGGVAPSVTVGERTLAAMHAAYAKSWYHTLTFRQRTTIYPTSGEPRVEQWFES